MSETGRSNNSVLLLMMIDDFNDFRVTGSCRAGPARACTKSLQSSTLLRGTQDDRNLRIAVPSPRNIETNRHCQHDGGIRCTWLWPSTPVPRSSAEVGA